MIDFERIAIDNALSARILRAYESRHFAFSHAHICARAPQSQSFDASIHITREWHSIAMVIMPLAAFKQRIAQSKMIVIIDTHADPAQR